MNARLVKQTVSFNNATINLFLPVFFKRFPFQQLKTDRMEVAL